MILAIRKPIARFMRYAFGRQYVFVLTQTGKMKLRRVFLSDWDGSRYVREDDPFPPAARIAIDGHQQEFKAWRPATFTEAERKALAVVDSLSDVGAELGKAAQDKIDALTMAAFAKAYAQSQQKAKISRP